MENQEPKHIRRKRYPGTHPRNFRDKYKELNPEQYTDDVAKIISQGKTPAGMHRPICVNEILEILDIKPGQVGLDATMGYGGHTIEILRRLQPNGKLIAIDVDSYELPKTEKRLRDLGFNHDILVVKRMNFSGIDQIVTEVGLMDFILADLGVSSMQIDNPERGFTFKVDGPLDLRLNPKSGKPASVILQTISQNDLQELLVENSDEPYHLQIAKTIISYISGGFTIETTIQLKNVISDALKFIPQNKRKEEINKSSQRVFQALRIAVNDEFSVLEKFLEELPYSLAPGGKVAILSFHSGEDRRVKKSFQHFNRLGLYSEVAPDPIRPSAEECFANPRAKSAKLRWAVKSKLCP